MIFQIIFHINFPSIVTLVVYMLAINVLYVVTFAIIPENLWLIQ